MFILPNFEYYWMKKYILDGKSIQFMKYKEKEILFILQKLNWCMQLLFIQLDYLSYSYY